MQTKVVLTKTATYDQHAVSQGMSEIFAGLGGLNSFIQPGQRVLIKPNMLEGLPPKRAVTTHPEVVRAVIREVKRVGGIPLVGDSPGTTGTLKAAEKCGIAAVCREEGAELVSFEETIDIPFPDGLTLKKFTLARQVSQVDKIISVAKMKTHTFMGITGATKNLFGLIVGMQKAQFHLRMQARREFAGMTVDLANLEKPVLSIVDGIEGMEGNGPRNGKPVHAGLLIGGTNCFAVDVVMAEVMGFKPEMSPIIALALERGLTPDIAGIELIGTAKDERRRFAEPRTLRALEDRVPKWAAKLGRHQLTARPEITGKCIACGRCAAHCPPKAMTVTHGKAHINYDMCIRCYCCQELCPADAVVLEEGALLKLARRFW